MRNKHRIICKRKMMRDGRWNCIKKLNKTKLKILPLPINLQNKIPKHTRKPNAEEEPTKLTIESKFDPEEIKMLERPGKGYFRCSKYKQRSVTH